MLDKTFNDTGTIKFEFDEYAVEFTYIGEGLCEEYNEDDPDDIPLIRFYVLEKNKDGEWEDMEDGSYCTLLPTDTPVILLENFAGIINSRIEDSYSPRKTLEELTWVTVNDLTN